jgi:glutamyl-tRNA reductase
MPIAIAGVDHTTCPVSVREPMALDGHGETLVLRELHGNVAIDEAVLLSTCARTEIYVSSEEHVETALASAAAILERMNPACSAYVWTRDGADAIRHAFRVSAGLESQVVGEAEITGQVRASVQLARSHGMLGRNLDDLFRAAIACSRRLRRETSLGDSDASVASAAASLLREKHELARSSVLIIGSGKVARMLATEFLGAKRLVVAARTPAGAATLAERLHISSMTLPAAIDQLGDFDVVCCATRSRHPLLSKSDAERAAPIVIFDVSVPRNVDPAGASVPGITLYDIDAVRPAGAIPVTGTSLIESIVDAEVHDYVSRQSHREVGPIIAALRAHVDQVRTQEIARLGAKLDTLDQAQRAMVESLTQRLIDRMFHHLVVRLKLAALTDPDLIRAADFFFAHGEDTLFPTGGESESEETSLREVENSEFRVRG